MSSEPKERDKILRIVWPKDASKDMLDRPYHRRCDDCGSSIRTGDLHLRIKHLGGRDKKAHPLCPDCGPKRGDVQDTVMKRGARSGESQSAPARRIITPGEFSRQMENDPRFRMHAEHIRNLAVQEINDKLRSGK